MTVDMGVATVPSQALSAAGDHLVFCSDLHLDDAPTDDRYDVDFEKFLATLGGRGERTGQLRLVLLGDILDFAETRAGRGQGARRGTQVESLHLLDAIADAHPRVFSALAQHVQAGFDLDFVVGNHDADLAWPVVQASIRHRLGARATAIGAVRFHPWLFHVPKVVYAEHGHQHHDINSFTTVLRPWRRSALELSMGEALADFRRSIGSARAADSSGSGRAAATSALLRVLGIQLMRRSGPWWRLARVRYRRVVLGAYAREIGLPARTVRALDHLTAHSAARIVRRVVRVAARRVSGRAREDYLYLAAGRVSAVLAGTDAQVPLYVFGHTHAAGQRPLTDVGDTPLYLNTGTWSPYRRGADIGEGPTFVLVTVGAGPPRGCVYRYGGGAQ